MIAIVESLFRARHRSREQFRAVVACAILSLAFTTFCGCGAPTARLRFPIGPLEQNHSVVWYAAGHAGRPGFGTSLDETGTLDKIYYADKENGKPDRIYRLDDYADDEVPHVLILLDSIPFDAITAFYRAGHLRFLGPPQKVIAPFPSLTEICFSDVLRAPPLPGMIDQSYDPRTNQVRSAFWDRVEGDCAPWQCRLDYHAAFWEDGMSFLEPRAWYGAELERARGVSEKSGSHVTIVYLGSSASMVCKYGRRGIAETLERAEQLCLEILYERHGAVKLSLMADHGHNLVHSINLPLADYLKQAGFHPKDSIDGPDDVVPEINGLVTYAGVQTSQPGRVADALLNHPHIQLVMYQHGERIFVRSSKASAEIECRGTKFRYAQIAGDVFNYKAVIGKLAAAGSVGADGFISDHDWFSATVDHEWPDAVRRVWDAFHRNAVYPPRVMLTVDDGYCVGLPEYEKYIDMASTHGSLNQLNSASFVMTMNRSKPMGAMRSREVLQWLEPGFEPHIRTNQ